MADALDAVEAITDREARVLAQSQALAEQAERAARWKAERDQLIVDLRTDGVSFRKIAARTGVSLGTVQDVLRGHSGPWGTRPRVEEEGSRG
ncbi:hypothetical protein V2S66_03405 [Streptomyces sp. V4-01]|uniref:Uncharacterized protein n=1 Tax=Actinacidiphila polyblastidii TaxID=3110430 RepID=A0ABU7P5C6_9ACTN|nr:hypothetical protein [Streptomyces sp. V4-01]